MVDRIGWALPGSKVYEAGVDRGVLYDDDNANGVAWNGLVSIEEDMASAAVTAFYFDGVPYLNTRVPSDFSATLRAFTFPDEFLEYDGVNSIAPGLYLHDQAVSKTFGLSYRTMIGNENDSSLGYKLHLVYNLTAQPDNRSYVSLSDSNDVGDMGWKIQGVPVSYSGFRPTVHVSLDSREIESDTLKRIEDILYGYLPGVGGSDVIDGGTPSSSFTLFGPSEVFGGTATLSSSDVIDGGTPSSSGDAGPIDAPGPRLPSLTELATIMSA